jgi:hypothetical protein
MGRWLVVKIGGDPRVFVVEFSGTELMTHVAKYFVDNYSLVPSKGNWVYAHGSRNLNPNDPVDSLPHMSRLDLKSNKSEDHTSSVSRAGDEQPHKLQTRRMAAAASGSASQPS